MKLKTNSLVSVAMSVFISYLIYALVASDGAAIRSVLTSISPDKEPASLCVMDRTPGNTLAEKVVQIMYYGIKEEAGNSNSFAPKYITTWDNSCTIMMDAIGTDLTFDGRVIGSTVSVALSHNKQYLGIAFIVAPMGDEAEQASQLLLLIASISEKAGI